MYSRSTLSKPGDLFYSGFCKILQCLLLAQIPVFRVHAQQAPATERFSIYSALLQDSIQMRHRYTTDSTSELSLQAAENRWLKTSLVFQNDVLWQGVPIDFRTSNDGSRLRIEYTFLGNKLVGYNFWFRKRNGQFEFYKKSEFQVLPDDMRNICNLKTQSVMKGSARIIDNGVLIGRCTVK